MQVILVPFVDERIFQGRNGKHPLTAAATTTTTMTTTIATCYTAILLYCYCYTATGAATATAATAAIAATAAAAPKLQTAARLPRTGDCSKVPMGQWSSESFFVSILDVWRYLNYNGSRSTMKNVNSGKRKEQ